MSKSENIFIFALGVGPVSGITATVSLTHGGLWDFAIGVLLCTIAAVVLGYAFIPSHDDGDDAL